MKKWLKKKFSDWCKEAWYNEHGKVSPTPDYDSHIIVGAKYNTTRSIETTSLNFALYPATGGHVLEMTINEYNPSQLQTNYPRKVLHIIPNGEDLGSALGKIITLEMLRK